MTYYNCTLMEENSLNQAALFNTVDKILNRKKQNKLPSYYNAKLSGKQIC